MITWETREGWLEQIPHKSQVRFALFCAMQIEEVWKDSLGSVNAVATVERWLEGKATAEECKDAAYYAAGAAAYPAYPAYYAAYCAAHHAVAYPAYPAYYAAYCAAQHAVADESLKQEQVEYLRELYFESLPEETRNSWLVQACL